MKAFGLVGWSGSGKTTLVVRLLPELTARGFAVSTIKHTHHDITIDRPGKDSYRHREAGATEVVLVSPFRWALMNELRGGAEPDLDVLLGRLSPVDLVLVEGFKSHPYPKLEVYRRSLGKPPLCFGDASIVALASDEPLGNAGVPVLDLADTAAIASFIIGHSGLER